MDKHVFKRTYAVEIDFDTPITFAEQDRLAGGSSEPKASRDGIH